MSFYDELLKSDNFCQKLGQLILTSGRLESILKGVVNEAYSAKNLTFATLGKLISTCKTDKLLDDEILEVLDFIKVRRNYLTHSLFPLFNEEIDVTLLPRDNLVSEDAEFYFSNCVAELIENMNFVQQLITKEKNTI